MLKDIQGRYTGAILAEALKRFGITSDSLQELEGSAFVYDGLLDGRRCILKIVPGVWNAPRQITGSTREQLLAEVEFVRYLAENDLPVARPVPSRQGEWVEVLPLDERACFLAYCFEKVPGAMIPDAEEVHFPEDLLVEWGHQCGRLHYLAERYIPDDPYRRLPWYADDLLDFAGLIPIEQALVYQRHDEILQRLNILPQDKGSFGLVHGDFHHGNFLVDGGHINLFDFDAANYFWYAGEVAVALYNGLPLPRSETGKRRSFALDYLRHFLQGYRLERSFDGFWVAQIPLFLKYSELLHYAYCYKYWDLSSLTDRRAGVLAEIRQRIEHETPVVYFESGDWDLLEKI